jgi:hypothetical protein
MSAAILPKRSVEGKVRRAQVRQKKSPPNPWGAEHRDRVPPTSSVAAMLPPHGLLEPSTRNCACWPRLSSGIIGFLPLPVDPIQWRWPAPFAPRALPRFTTTTEQSAPNPRIGTFGLAIGAACAFSLLIAG